MTQSRFMNVLTTCLIVVSAWVLAAGTATAQSYPDRPIRLVVPFGAGSSADVPTRRVAQEMTRLLGQPVIIDNKAGAGGIVGSDLVAKAQPDGYTLLAGSVSTHVLNAGLYKSLPYDPMKGFAPISRIASFTNVLVVPSSLGVTNMSQLIALAKKEKEPLTFSSTGSGTTLHLQGEMFQRAAGVKLLHVPYADPSQYLPDLITGRTSMTFGNLPTILPYIKNGKLIPIAITTAQRSPLLPNTPTMAEAGFQNFEVAAWMALYAPVGTPPAIVKKLNDAVNSALQTTSVREAYAADGNTVVSDPSSAEFGEFHRQEMTRWMRIIDNAGIPKQ